MKNKNDLIGVLAWENISLRQTLDALREIVDLKPELSDRRKLIFISNILCDCVDNFPEE